MPHVAQPRILETERCGSGALVSQVAPAGWVPGQARLRFCAVYGTRRLSRHLAKTEISGFLHPPIRCQKIVWQKARVSAKIAPKLPVFCPTRCAKARTILHTSFYFFA